MADERNGNGRPPGGAAATSPWAPPRGRPAGWYRDSRGLPGDRYFDGHRWTEDFRGRFEERARDHTPTLDVRAAVGAAAVLLVSLVASRFLVEALIPQRWPILAYTGISIVSAYGPSVVWCWWSSKRWGTGHLIRDLGLRPRWSDLGWGPLVWLVTLTGQIGAAMVVVALGIPFTSNTDGIDGLPNDRTYVIALLVAAVVAAPIVEEMVFRAVVQRGLRSRFSAVPAVLIQGVLFGAAHFDPARGTGNIGLIIVLSTVGILLGGAVEQLGRVPPAMIAHAIINSIALAVVWSR